MNRWRKQGLTWLQWRSKQANLAVFYYIQNNDSQKTVSQKFGISTNAFSSAFRYFKSKNKIKAICRC